VGCANVRQFVCVSGPGFRFDPALSGPAFYPKEEIRYQRELNSLLTESRLLLEVATKANKRQPATSKTSALRVSAGRRVSSALASNDDEAIGQDHSKPALPVLVRNQTKTPVITGEVHYKGMIPVDGTLVGQLGDGGRLEVRQKSQPKLRLSQPELSGELSFRDVVRINGHIAGTVYSEKGTLIVDSGAALDANVDVAIAVIRGTVNGDIVAQQRVELGAGAKVFGNIWTRSIAVEVGATFDGVCTMLENH
jgi:cytoskeletal protein CcmA (bactofilin family)